MVSRNPKKRGIEQRKREGSPIYQRSTLEHRGKRAKKRKWGKSNRGLLGRKKGSPTLKGGKWADDQPGA